MAPSAEDAAVGRLRAAVRRLAVLTQARAWTGRSHDDADEAAGTVDTDDAHGFDPFPLLRALHEHGARVAVMGSLTGDLDLLWDGASEQAPAPALAVAFGSVLASLTDDDGAPVACGPAAFALPKLLFRCPTSCGDCCTPALPWGELPVADFLTRCRVVIAREGFEIRYLDLPDLIWMRRAVARTKDLRRADELEQLANLAG